MATEKESGLNIDGIVECPTCCGDGVIPTPDPRWHPAPPTRTEEPDKLKAEIQADAQMLLDALAGPTAELRRLREQIETMRTWLDMGAAEENMDDGRRTAYALARDRFNALFPPERPKP